MRTGEPPNSEGLPKFRDHLPLELLFYDKPGGALLGGESVPAGFWPLVAVSKSLRHVGESFLPFDLSRASRSPLLATPYFSEVYSSYLFKAVFYKNTS